MAPTSLTLTLPDAEWMAAAICRTAPAVMEAETPEDERHAKALCGACPVRGQCRDWTLSLPPREDVYGVAGGMTAKQRRLVRNSLPAEAEEPRACTGCKAVQPADEFYRRPSQPGGRETQCKTCCRERGRAYKAAKRTADKAAMA